MMHEMSILQRAIAKYGEEAQMKMVLEETGNESGN